MERSWVHGPSLFEPELDLVAIRIRDVGERKARCKLASPKKLAACTFHLGDGAGNVFRPLQAKSEVSDSAGGACLLGRAFECQDVERARPSDLNLVVVPEVLANPERLGIELERLLRIAYRKADMRKPVSLEHRCG